MEANYEEQQWWKRFKELLDDGLDWPNMYVFKFIVPRANVASLEELFSDHPLKRRESSNGNYVSITATLNMKSSEEVIAVYNSAAKIEGIILL